MQMEEGAYGTLFVSLCLCSASPWILVVWEIECLPRCVGGRERVLVPTNQRKQKLLAKA